MTKPQIALTALAAALLAGCATGPSAEQQAAYAADSRGAVGELVKTLVGELKQDIATVGPEGAITVCKDKAPKIAGGIAQKHGVSIKRVTFKNRNAQRSTPDEWEAQALRELEKRFAQGVKGDGLEYYQVVDGPKGKTFRYMKGLVTAELCMTCHGTSETIPPAVQAKLAAEYPNDKATGYLPNQFRGGVSIQRPL